MKLDILKLPLGQMGANCYIVGGKILIDPGAQGDALVGYLKQNGYVIEAILLTHGHFDHIGAVKEVVDEFHCPVYIHPRDEEVVYDDRLNLSAYYTPLDYHLDLTLVDGPVKIAGEEIEFINLPGHTHGSCFIVFSNHDVIFSGDVLFKGSIGRYDFPTSSVSETKETLKQIYAMDKDYTVYPGHGEETTLFFEQKTNPFFKS